MKDIGLQGQIKLKNARVLIIGAGGLGSPASLYLAGAGIGTIGIVDADKVDESNLHRQVIHNEDWVGKPKVESAKHHISKFNSKVNMVTYEENLTPQNALSIIKEGDWHIVMDATDNAPARYLVNDACVSAKVPLVSGSAIQWEGQATVYNFKNGPCYRCLFPIPPPASTVTSCANGGVLGMVPGIIGNI
jgi:adenylyltransferase and sulfurtransferase